MADKGQGELEYLLGLQSIRERANKVWAKGESNSLQYFDVDSSKWSSCVQYVLRTIQNGFQDRANEIPPHGRWQHFSVADIDRISELLGEWTQSGVSQVEQTRRLVDLFFVAVLLDAGAGDQWTFKDPSYPNVVVGRSEGLAIASLYAFKSGLFSADSSNECQVNGSALQVISQQKFMAAMQSSETNELAGLDGRVGLLSKLGSSLSSLQTFFGSDARPGNIVDYLQKKSVGNTVSVQTLWAILQTALLPIWPTGRLEVAGQPLGDAWRLSTLRTTTGDTDGDGTDDIQPFHKLTQWLAYSLMVPLQKLGGFSWIDSELLTGLPEYRNGGVMLDLGFLSLKSGVANNAMLVNSDSGEQVAAFPTASGVIVEWRAMTVVFLDKLLVDINSALESQGSPTLSLAQMLEAGSWKAGRLLAAEKRPKTRGPPIAIISDGTVF